MITASSLIEKTKGLSQQLLECCHYHGYDQQGLDPCYLYWSKSCDRWVCKCCLNFEHDDEYPITLEEYYKNLIMYLENNVV